VRSFRSVPAAARRALGRAIRADIRQPRSESTLTGEQLDEVKARLDALTARVDWLTGHGGVLERRQGETDERVASLQGLVAIDAVTRFVRHARIGTQPLVSVVLPTYDRPDRLRRAIDSVVAQRYPRWELLVVDDGGTIDSEVVVDAVGDPRVRWMRIAHQGVCAARNAALATVRGEIVAYLDDDNVMDPDWLQAVAWGFDQRPDVDVLYGAVVVDDMLRVDQSSSGQLPRAFLNAWNRESLRTGNLADIGAIAHRRGLPEARFDERLREMGDWDVLIRLTREREPLVLPVIACYYTTDAPDRLSSGPTHDADLATVMSRAPVVQR
jgi:hypothetical protein